MSHDLKCWSAGSREIVVPDCVGALDSISCPFALPPFRPLASDRIPSLWGCAHPSWQGREVYVPQLGVLADCPLRSGPVVVRLAGGDDAR